MKLFSNKKPICEVQVCDNFLPEDPAIIQLDEHQFHVCDDCARIMEHINEKFEERLNDESL